MAECVDQDNEEEWEDETLAIVELKGFTDDLNEMTSRQAKCKIVGIESDTPMLQLDHFIFNGHYEDISGTMLLMESQSMEPVKKIFPHLTEQSEQLCHYGNTFKKLVMTRAFLTERDIGLKKTEEQNTDASDHDELSPKKTITQKSQHEIGERSPVSPKITETDSTEGKNS